MLQTLTQTSLNLTSSTNIEIFIAASIITISISFFTYSLKYLITDDNTENINTTDNNTNVEVEIKTDTKEITNKKEKAISTELPETPTTEEQETPIVVPETDEKETQTEKPQMNPDVIEAYGKLDERYGTSFIEILNFFADENYN
jgi:hypothetical protein